MKWYQTTWAAVLFLFVFAPVGIFLMFKYHSWKLPIKVANSVIFGFFFLAALVGSFSNPDAPTVATSTPDIVSSTPEATSTPSAEPPAPSTVEPSSAPASTPEPEEAPETTPETTAPPAITTPEPTPEPSSEPEAPAPALAISSALSVWHRNEDATISIIGKPNTEYRLRVFYKSESDADGLGVKTSDADGRVSWTWHIGGRTSIGDFHATITGGGETIRHDFTIEE